MDVGRILWICGLLAEIAVVVLLIRKHFFRILPVFSAYLTWSLFPDIVIYLLRLHFPRQYLLLYYLPEVIVDSVFQFSVLVELGWSVLRPVRPNLKRQSVILVALLIALAGVVIWPIAGHAVPSNLGNEYTFWVHLQQTGSLLKIVLFLALAALSQVLAIGWRDRELQIATGLGFYSLVSFAVSIMHTNAAFAAQFRTLELFPVAAYVCSLVYWIISFAQEEAPRREMSPEMRNVLLAIAGAARTTRGAMTGSRNSTRDDHTP